MKKHDKEHKHFLVVLNHVAYRLLKILYALIKNGEMYNPMYVNRDPRLKAAD